jgi:class 3 adenylate cyclase
VTIVFTDVVESTARMSRLGEARAEAMRRRHFGLLRSIINDYRGREVKNLGDGLMVAFESAVDAVMCGAAMQRRMELERDEDGGASQMRVAMSTGEADIDNDDYFGLPVVEASRLCGVCEPGQILVSDLTRILVGSRTMLEFTRLGELELKGLKPGFVAHAVEWRGAGSAPRLHVTTGGATTIVDLHANWVRIGRAVENDITIDDHGVSRLHARVEHESGLWRLVDLGSTNGTCVNGEPVPRWHARVLSNGDRIEIGDAELEFVDETVRPSLPGTQTTRKADPKTETA